MRVLVRVVRDPSTGGVTPLLTGVSRLGDEVPEGYLKDSVGLRRSYTTEESPDSGQDVPSRRLEDLRLWVLETETKGWERDHEGQTKEPGQIG